MVRSHVVSSARCFIAPKTKIIHTRTHKNICRYMYSFIPRDEKWVGKVMMMMMVAHLRMIKDKVREQDQIEACTRRTCVWHWQQRVEERINGRSPHVPQHAAHGSGGRTGTAGRRLDVQVLRYVVGQIVEERLVRVIRKDHLLQHIDDSKFNCAASA
jgi:hypothetical protein